MNDCSLCPAKLSHVQGNKQDLRRALGAIDALDPPATLGGWVLLGSILESHGGVFVPTCLQGQASKVVVETMLYVLVRHNESFNMFHDILRL